MSALVENMGADFARRSSPTTTRRSCGSSSPRSWNRATRWTRPRRSALRPEAGEGEVIDLMEALKRSIEKEARRRGICCGGSGLVFLFDGQDRRGTGRKDDGVQVH